MKSIKQLLVQSSNTYKKLAQTLLTIQLFPSTVWMLYLLWLKSFPNSNHWLKLAIGVFTLCLLIWSTLASFIVIHNKKTNALNAYIQSKSKLTKVLLAESLKFTLIFLSFIPAFIVFIFALPIFSSLLPQLFGISFDINENSKAIAFLLFGELVIVFICLISIFSLSQQTILFENKSVRQSLSKSKKLVAQNFKSYLMRFLIIYLPGVIMSVILILLNKTTPQYKILFDGASQIFTFFFRPFVAIYMYLLYKEVSNQT